MYPQTFSTRWMTSSLRRMRCVRRSCPWRRFMPRRFTRHAPKARRMAWRKVTGRFCVCLQTRAPKVMAPDIREKIVVVWLGGDPAYLGHTREFNLRQDIPASRLLFDCGVPLVQIPCAAVASHPLTSLPELEQCLRGKNRISSPGAPTNRGTLCV